MIWSDGSHGRFVGFLVACRLWREGAVFGSILALAGSLGHRWIMGYGMWDMGYGIWDGGCGMALGNHRWLGAGDTMFLTFSIGALCIV